MRGKARRLVGMVGVASSTRCMTRISEGDSARSLATKVAMEDGPTSSAGFGAFSPCSAAKSNTHSMINEPSNSLIGLESAPTPPAFTVRFTVKVRGSSIGAGLRAIRPNVTFQDLSRTIDSWRRP